MKFLVIILFVWSTQAMAESVQVTFAGKVLNGNLMKMSSSRTIFLIVHGTWAHSGMEIITSLQSLLAESGENSLAINMSLGIDNLADAYKAQTELFRDNANVSEIWIDGSGHFFRDLYADKLVEQMLEWLQQ